MIDEGVPLKTAVRGKATTTRNPALMVGLALAVGCSAGLTETQRRERAAQEAVRENARRDMAVRHAAHKSGCQAVAIVAAVPAQVRYFTVGCGVMSHVGLTCLGDRCFSNLVGATRLDRPRRLQQMAKRLWRDPSGVAEIDNRPRIDGKDPRLAYGQLIINPQEPPYRVGLPGELRISGLAVAGRFEVCVTKLGQVGSIEVIRSPAGLESHWFAIIENWRYRPLRLDNAPIPFCYTLDLSVAAG
jgi:hypothetical protein